MCLNRVNSTHSITIRGYFRSQFNHIRSKSTQNVPNRNDQAEKQGAGSERSGRESQREWASDENTNQNIHVVLGIEGGGVDGVQGRRRSRGGGGPRQGRGGRDPGASGRRGVGVVEAGEEVARAPGLLVHCPLRGATGCRHGGEASRQGSESGRRGDRRL